MRIKPIHEGYKQKVERDFDSWEGHVSKNEGMDPLATNSMDNNALCSWRPNMSKKMAETSSAHFCV